MFFLLRFARKGGSLKGILNDSRVKITETMEEKQDFLWVSSKVDDRVDEKEDEIEANEFTFTFKFPTFDEFMSKNQKKSSEVSLKDSEVDANSNAGFESEFEGYAF